MLLHEYRSVCVRCRAASYHRLIPEGNPLDVVAAEGKCKCGYVGPCDLKYIGNVTKDIWNVLNKDAFHPDQEF